MKKILFVSVFICAVLSGADLPHWERGKGTWERYTLVGAPGGCEIKIISDSKELEGDATEKVRGISYDHTVTVIRLADGHVRATEQFVTVSPEGLYSKADSGLRLFQKYCVHYGFLLPLSVRQMFAGTSYEIPAKDPIWQEFPYDSGDYDKGYAYRGCVVMLRKDRQGVVVVSHSNQPFAVDARQITDETITISKDGEKAKTAFSIDTVFKDRRGYDFSPEGVLKQYVFTPLYQDLAHALPQEAQDLFFGEFGLGKEPVK